MDNDYPIDVDEILSVLKRAEVMVLRFMIFPQRLLIDPRYTDRDGPMLKVVPPVSSAEERFRTLRRLRPRFSLPERVTVVHWPKFVSMLESSGVWAGIDQRMRESGYPGTGTEVAEALCELQRLERQEMRNAIRGEGYKTVWTHG